MWIEPKTNWKSTDKINFSDYNRIKNNISHLRDIALTLYSDFPWNNMGADKNSYAQYPYADEFNNLENNLVILRNYTYAFYSGNPKTWYENQRTPNFEDLNRLESACLKMYNGLNLQADMRERLAFRLGNAKQIKE